MVGKEVLAGLVNGVVMGSVAILVAVLMGHGIGLGVVVLLAMTGNLFVAGFAGGLIPIVLSRFGVTRPWPRRFS